MCYYLLKTFLIKSWTILEQKWSNLVKGGYTFEKNLLGFENYSS